MAAPQGQEHSAFILIGGRVFLPSYSLKQALLAEYHQQAAQEHLSLSVALGRQSPTASHPRLLDESTAPAANPSSSQTGIPP